MKILWTILFLFLFSSLSYAARSHTVTLLGSPINYTMRDYVAMALMVTNTNTRPNTSLSINRMRFTFPTGMTVQTSGHTAPTGWTVSVNTARNRITFSSTNSSYNIKTGNFKIFIINLYVNPQTADSTLEKLKKSRATYYDGKKHTLKKPSTVSWYRRSLKITSIVALPDSINSGDNFTLSVTIQNRSSATKTGIITSPSPPNSFITGVVTLNNPSPSPPSLTLAALASGTLIFTYTTGTNDDGTVYFTCSARNDSNNATSVSAKSNTISVGKLRTSMSISPDACILSGERISLTMTVTNNYSFSLTNVTPTLNTVGTASFNRVSGPTPPSIATLGSGGSATFTWEYDISGIVDNTFQFTGFVTGTRITPPGTFVSPTAYSQTRYIRGYSVSMTPDNVFGGAENVFLNIKLKNTVNLSCPTDSNYYVNDVTIGIPSDFVLASNSASSIIENDVNDENDPNYEYYSNLWNITYNSGSINFKTTNTTYYLKDNKDAEFTLLISKTPQVSIDTSYTLPLNVINAKGINKTINDASVQLIVTNKPIGGNVPSPTKGGTKEKLN